MPTKLTVTRPADFIEFQKASIFQGIHQRIEEQVRLYPANIALKTKEVEYTYRELNGHANSIADAILRKCGKNLAQAAILLPNTSEMIIAILGALKAHKAYVPLDRNFPMERLRTMFADAESSVLLTDDAHHSLAEELAGGSTSIINISQIERHTDTPNPNVNCDPLDRAYLIYTSGTTGRPKGVVFLHRNLLHTTMCLTNELFFAPSDRVTWLHSPSFGSSVVDIYCCLMNGATLYPWDSKVQGFNGLTDWLTEQKVTTFQWLPSGFRQFVRTIPDGFQFSDIRIVTLAGEPLTIREVELFRRYFSVGSHLVNQVGTGESYNYRLYPIDHQIPIEDANVAGGYSVSSERRVLILDDDHKEISQGGSGEIGIESDYMAAGYWGDEELTQRKFIRNGAGDVPIYLTGDLGRFEQDGCLIHLGRKDFQFKIRGVRIEPAEVEHALTRAPGVADCACWVAKNRLDEDQLVGYVVPREPGKVDQRELENYLEALLPSYMVPRTYVFMESLPALPNGKANRKALPNPFIEANTNGSAAPVASSGAENKLLDIFRDLLQLDQVTPETDFLSAGGDSLSAVVLRLRIYETFGVEISMDKFVRPLTPARLSSSIVSPSGPYSSGLPLARQELSGFSPSPRISFPLPLNGTAMKVVVDKAGTGKQVSAKYLHQSERTLVIIGAGGCGREVFIWATQAIAAGNQLQIKGFLDDRACALEGMGYEKGILGSLSDYEIDEKDVFVCAIGDPAIKIKCHARIAQRGGVFTSIIHPLANIGQNVELGEGVVMGPFSSITCDAKVGNHTSIGALSNVAHDTVLGDWCQISSHCGVNGNATLGDGVFLGSHACILPGVKVGPWAFVGAGSVVVRTVSPLVHVFGNPASPIGTVGNA
jgi:sugar O-acyltransferase (sialic acid O-acetyltransferase NeuD family)